MQKNYETILEEIVKTYGLDFKPPFVPRAAAILESMKQPKPKKVLEERKKTADEIKAEEEASLARMVKKYNLDFSIPFYPDRKKIWDMVSICDLLEYEAVCPTYLTLKDEEQINCVKIIAKFGLQDHHFKYPFDFGKIMAVLNRKLTSKGLDRPDLFRIGK